MENALQILQTIGICVSAVALTAIAILTFSLWITFSPIEDMEDEDNESFKDRKKKKEKQY